MAFDGARPDWTAGYMENGDMPNLTRLAQRGVTAAYLQAVDPAVAATSYQSLSTGASPSDTGWVSTGFPTAGTAFLAGRNPLEHPVTSLEAVWRTAMRNGLRTATVFWPGASLDVPSLQANYMVEVAESNVPSAQHVVSLREAQGWKAAPTSLSPLQEGLLPIHTDEGGTLDTLNILATDQPDDGPGGYDLLILDSDKDLQNGYSSVSLGECTLRMLSPRLHSGAYFCFTASDGLSVTLYHSRVSYNRGRPAELLRSVNDLGFPPPTPDLRALRQGWLAPQQYHEMAERRAKWMMDVVLHVYRTYRPDLLLTAQAIIGECTRAFLLVDERQPGFEPESAELYAGYRQKAHALADENLGKLLSLVDVANSAVLVLSAHGLAPVHTEVHLNTILEDAGLLDLDTRQGQDYLDPGESQAVAWASGGSAYVYLNLQGRDQPGIVTPDDYQNVQQQIVSAVTKVVDEDGQAVFARSLTREQLKGVQLNSPYAGDVFVQAAPGYYLSDALGLEDILAPSTIRAVGGLDSALPEMHGMFIAAGANLARGKAIAAVHLTDIAPTVARILGFEPASTVHGHRLEDVWR